MSKDEFLQQVIDINPLNIAEHFQRVPAELAYYNQQYADAVSDYLISKAKCDRAHAVAYVDLAEATDSRGKKLTVAAIEAAIQLDAEYQAAKAAFISSEANKQELRGKVDVVSAKKEMLISLGAHLRVEMSDPMVKAQAAARRETTPDY